ncbi:MAG: dTDP-4-dehydrorhamnose 3,5-epimerase [Acidimicrobiia bacterium]|nr:dTDP-4-dehydrorhamnose 3,5-epimerase [Acidimicrobiia bacterium]
MPPSIHRLDLPEVLLIQPEVHGDSRGFFMETWNQRDFDEAVGREVRFVQDNHSRSGRGVLRGLHYQLAPPQGKLVHVVAGAVFDVAVDVRRGSPTLGKHVAAELSAESKTQLWIPEGFAHGFLVLTEYAEVLYKATTYYDPGSERSIRWDDPELGIDWPVVEPDLSERDRRARPFAESELLD